jgi:uncharacterized membrane protein
VESTPRSHNRSALGLAGVLAVAGVAHFVAPDGFDAIVPRVLPGSRRFWTIVSGAAEVVVAVGVARPATRRVSATGAAVLFVLVFPANVQMAIDWRSRPAPEFAASLLRLPLQIPLVWWAGRVRKQAAPDGWGVASVGRTTSRTV